MDRYLSTCLPGIQTLAGDWVTSAGAKIVDMDEGTVVYDVFRRETAQYRFWTNSYQILLSFDNPGIGNMLRQTPEKTSVWTKTAETLLKSLHAKTFRILYSQNGKLKAMPQEAMRFMERTIAKTCAMRWDRSHPDVNFYFISRSNGKGYFAIQLPKQAEGEKALPKGALHADLCDVLVRLGGLTQNVFWDAFCGYGSVIQARMQYAYGDIFATDNDNKMVELSCAKIGVRKRLDIYKLDVLNPKGLAPVHTDTIIADPPWGLYEKIDIAAFYDGMLKTFEDSLKTKGKLVLLTANQPITLQAIAKHPGLSLLAQYPIQYAGISCCIYLLESIARI